MKLSLPTNALAACALSAALVSTPFPSIAVSLEEAVGEVVAATEPFIKAQDAAAVGSFETKLIDTLLTAKPAELGKTIDAGIDVFLSLPKDKVASLTETVKSAAAQAKPGGCSSTIVPAPPFIPAAQRKLFASSEAVAAADPAKVKAFADAAGPALKALDGLGSGETICLPPTETLNKLALNQIDISTAADPDAVKAFEKQSKVAGKTIPLAKLSGLLPEAKKLPGIRTAMTGDELKDQKRLRAALPVLQQKVAQMAKERAMYGP